MKTCKSCKGNRISLVSAKCSDACYMSVQGVKKEHDGYVPRNMGIGGGDYVEFSYCLDCGQIQDKFPVKVNFSDE